MITRCSNFFLLFSVAQLSAGAPDNRPYLDKVIEHQIVGYALSSQSNSPITQWLTARQHLIQNQTPVLAESRATTGFLDSKALSGNGKRAITISGHDSTLRVWDLDTEKIIAMYQDEWLSNHQYKVSSLVLNHSGTLAVIGFFDGEIAVWDVNNNQIVDIFYHCRCGRNNYIVDWVCLSQDESKVISKSINQEYNIHDLMTRKLLIKFYSKASPIITEDGSHVITLGEHGNIEIFDIASGTLIATLQNYDTTGNDDITIKNIRLVPHKNVLIAESFGFIKLWDLQKRTLIISIRSYSLNSFITPDGSHIITNEGDGMVYDTQTGNHIGYFSPSSYFQEIKMLDQTTVLKLKNLTFYTPAGSSESSEAVVTDIATGKHMTALRTPCDDISLSRLVGCAFNPDKSKIITHYFKPSPGIINDNIFTVWDVKTGMQIANFINKVTKSIITHDGSRIVTSDEDGILKIWKIQPDLHSQLSTLSIKQIRLLEWAHAAALKNKKLNLTANCTGINSVREQYRLLPESIKDLISEFVTLSE